MKISKTSYAGFSTLNALLVAIQTLITNTHALLVNLIASMLTLTETGGTITTTGALQVLFIHDAPSGVYSPKSLAIDFTNQFGGTTVEIGLHHRIKSGGNYRLIDSLSFVGIQTNKLKIIDLTDNRFGLYLTIQKTAGVNYDYDFEVFYEI